ncbi:M23 family metallopeptidase [Paenibacillus cremeus]|uniref:Peptidoglycan DD-metalloendopeptidase family protein n=1 Tax=Paenibacillus cremeus TaxID=2163881 RepID=A0A559K976_9BACL|nr:M23 family metallopeptidase [Paenibacillus cremeus]TVY08686.1 peptidoglycan DD-metalloendopeptidase family protein [Paenibacillus cremeus]
MKFKKFEWGMKKLTFVIVPDNAHRSVMQVRLSPVVFYAAGAVLVGLMAWGGLWFGQQHQRAHANAQLQADLNGKMKQLDQALADKDVTLAGKDAAIEQLQGEVMRLSEQAKDVKTKMEAVQKLEEDLRSMTGGEAGKATALAAPSSQLVTSSGTGQGGVMIPATAEDILKLSEDTSAQFAGLTQQMSELQSNLTSTREEVLQKQQKLRATPSIWPVDSRSITSPWGYRRDPINNLLSFHSGLDIAEQLNAKVRVTADGVVVATGYDDSRGNNILVDHTGGIRTWYMHLNKILVSKGDKVQKGDFIGLVGTTGRSTGPHLHYEVLKQGQSIDPRGYLK